LSVGGCLPAQEKDQVRSQLAGSLCAVLAQKLLPTRQGEELRYTSFGEYPAVANLIREGKLINCPGDANRACRPEC
jgi:twitching motility protein PilT